MPLMMAISNSESTFASLYQLDFTLFIDYVLFTFSRLFTQLVSSVSTAKKISPCCKKKQSVVSFKNKFMNRYPAETLAETIESGPLCITDLFQNKSVFLMYNYFLLNFLILLLALYYVNFQCGPQNIFRKIYEAFFY